MDGAALLGANSQVQRDASRLPSSRAEPLPVRHRGEARGNQGAPLHDRVHLPTYLITHFDLWNQTLNQDVVWTP